METSATSRTSHLVRAQNESRLILADAARERLSKLEPLPWRVDLSVGWFGAIAAGELKHTNDTVLRFTGTAPLSLEDYFRAFPKLLRALHLGQDRTSAG
jgi:hypothetical protein